MGLSKEEVIQKLEAAPEAKFVIRTEDEDKSFIENFKQSEVEKLLGERVSELHSRYDADILEVTGLRKDPKEKTYEFNKRVMKEYLGKISAYEKKIEELSKGHNPKNDDKIKELEGLIEQIKQEKDNEIQRAKHETVTYKTRTEFDKALSKLPIDPSIPERARQALVETTIGQLMNAGEWREEGLVFKDEKGEVLRNKQTYKPLTAEELLTDQLNDILKKERKMQGADIPGDGRKPSEIPGTLPPHVTTKVQLSEYLKNALKLKPSSKEYIELYALGKDLPLQ
jgi:hypothetical protein